MKMYPFINKHKIYDIMNKNDETLITKKLISIEAELQTDKLFI